MGQNISPEILSRMSKNSLNAKKRKNLIKSLKIWKSCYTKCTIIGLKVSFLKTLKNRPTTDKKLQIVQKMAAWLSNKLYRKEDNITLKDKPFSIDCRRITDQILWIRFSFYTLLTMLYLKKIVSFLWTCRQIADKNIS